MGRSRTGHRHAYAAAAAIAALFLAAAPAAGAKGFTVKAKSGTITLSFSAEALKTIDSGSSTVGTITTPIAPATDAVPGTFVFPISHGTLNSASGKGSVSAHGGLQIESHLKLSGLLESTTSASASNPSAVIGGSSTLSLTSPNFTPSTVALFTLGTAHPKVSGSRHAVTVSRVPAHLTAAGAQFFGGSFKAGQQIATLTIQAKG